MPNTSLGTPYVSASDLVAGYPTVSLDLANKVDTKADYAMPVNAQTGTTYTFVLGDGLKLTSASNASPVTLTIPPQSSVVWPNNTILRVVNYGAGAVTIAGGVGVTVTNAAKTLAQFESAALIRTASNAWTLTPFSGGAAKATVTSTTGSPTITTVGGKTVYKWTGDGSVTIAGTGGSCDILVVGGGGSGARGGGSTYPAGGGGGGVFALTSAFLAGGSQTVTVGVGGAAQTTASTTGNFGADSRIGPYYAGGGGAGSHINSVLATARLSVRMPGGCGGGGGANNEEGLSQNGGRAVGGVGFAGGNATASTGSGGGGGASAAGTNGTSNTGGNGGAGVANNFETGSNQTYGGGGGGTGVSTQGSGGAGGGTAGVQAGTSTAGTDGLGGGSGGGGTGSGKGGNGVVVLVIG